jgi:hypothetical protein
MPHPHLHPSKNYSAWCLDAYGPPKYPNNLSSNFIFGPAAQPILPFTNWTTSWPKYNKLQQGKLAGLWEGYTLQDLQTQPDEVLQHTFTRLEAVLQPDLRAKAGGIGQQHKWEVFSGQFAWLKPENQQQADVCMPFKQTLVSKGCKKADKVPFMYYELGYLSVLLGYDYNNQPVKEYAHRLLCLCWHGIPTKVNQNQQIVVDWDLVVNHQCCNKACLNPRHLEWVTMRENKVYQGVGMGLVP